jgi:DNA-binding MarR family transcriptional regulator
VLGAVAEAHGLTVQQAVTLMQLETPVPMRGVASAFQCDASNVTGLVDRLEAHDLVERRADPADRRVRLLALTEHGAEIRDSMKAALMLQDPTPGLTAAQRHKLLALLMLVDDTAPPAPLG